MANILLSAKYSTEAFGAAVQEGMVSRRNVISETVASLGMTCEAIYVTPMADHNILMLLDGTAEQVTALMKLVIPTGTISDSSVTFLMTPEDFDAAGGAAEYRAPGQ
tara:strand:- start:81 stop:401 length:321 start_codon:yes stop_codon:yes gene_type:complete